MVILHQKVKPNNHGDIMGQIWTVSQVYAKSMDGTTWLFCIKKRSLITTVTQWVDVLMLTRPIHNFVLRGIISGGLISGGGGRGEGKLITGLLRYSDTNSMGGTTLQRFSK